MTQRQLFHALLILFCFYLFLDGFRLFINVIPELLPAIEKSLYNFSREGGWPLPTVSYLLPRLVPALTTLGLTSLILLKASDLATWLFPEASNAPLIFHLKPEECLRWGITLLGIFLLGWLTLPSLISTIVHPLVMLFAPPIDPGKTDLAFIDNMYWSSFIRNIANSLILGSFGLICLLFAGPLAAWIIRIQKHPKPSRNE